MKTQDKLKHYLQLKETKWDENIKQFYFLLSSFIKHILKYICS
jgi:hypothetical protein